MARLLYIFSIVSILSLIAVPRVSLAGEGNATLAIGSAVPALSLQTVSGGTFSLDELKGKPVVLTFYASWSQSCFDALKFLQGIHDTVGKVRVVTVSFDGKSSLVSSFLNRNNFDFISLIDKKKRYLDDFQILVVPTTYLIDKNGVLKNVYVDFDDAVKGSLSKDITNLVSDENKAE